MLAAFWALLVAVGPIVRLSGSSVACPSTEEVESKLIAFMPGAAGPAAPDTATLVEHDHSLSVVVTGPDGSILGRRDFPRTHSCPDLAAAIALVIATWESNVHPEYVLSVPAQGDTPTASPGSIPSTVAPVTLAARPPDDRPPQGSPGFGTRGSFDLGVGLLLQAAPNNASDSLGGDLSIGAAFLAGWVPQGRRLGVRVAIAAGTARALTIGDAEARWQRMTFAAGPMVRWDLPGPLSAVDLHAEVLGAGLNIQGSGFATNEDRWTFDAGGGAGARLWLGTGRWRPWLDAGVQVWSRRHVVYVRPSGDGASLPPVEGSMTLGLAFMTAPAAGSGR